MLPSWLNGSQQSWSFRCLKAHLIWQSFGEAPLWAELGLLGQKVYMLKQKHVIQINSSHFHWFAQVLWKCFSVSWILKQYMSTRASPAHGLELQHENGQLEEILKKKSWMWHRKTPPHADIASCQVFKQYPLGCYCDPPYLWCISEGDWTSLTGAIRMAHLQLMLMTRKMAQHKWVFHQRCQKAIIPWAIEVNVVAIHWRCSFSQNYSILNSNLSAESQASKKGIHNILIVAMVTVLLALSCNECDFLWNNIN